jgi:hypothetical protein
LPLRAYFTVVTAEGRYASAGADGQVKLFQERLANGQCRGFVAASEPALADVIVLVETEKHKFADYVSVLYQNPLLHEFPERCFTYNFEDGPIGFLPGVYVSLPKAKSDPMRTRAGGYVWLQNSEVAQTHLQVDEATVLFSFRGSISHPVRRRLLEQRFPGLAADRYAMTLVDKWFTHDANDRTSYARELQKSRFVLCPRGVGTASHRIFETMASARVPVIIGDDWAAPLGPAWEEFSLRVPEDRLADLPDVIQAAEPKWRLMGASAREAWVSWFSPESGPGRILQWAAELAAARPAGHDERACQAGWKSWHFAYVNGWTLPQRVIRKVGRIIGRKS